MIHCEHTSDIKKRLSRIAGQVNGVKDMVENARECDEILVQLSSINSALTQVARLIVTEHLEHHVLEGFENGNREETVETLKKVVEQFAKMK